MEVHLQEVHTGSVIKHFWGNVCAVHSSVYRVKNNRSTTFSSDFILFHFFCMLPFPQIHLNDKLSRMEENTEANNSPDHMSVGPSH